MIDSQCAEILRIIGSCQPIMILCVGVCISCVPNGLDSYSTLVARTTIGLYEAPSSMRHIREKMTKNCSLASVPL